MQSFASFSNASSALSGAAAATGQWLANATADPSNPPLRRDMVKVPEDMQVLSPAVAKLLGIEKDPAVLDTYFDLNEADGELRVDSEADSDIEAEPARETKAPVVRRAAVAAAPERKLAMEKLVLAAQAWLARPMVVEGLQTLGLTAAQVETQLQSNAAHILEGYPARVLAGINPSLAFAPRLPSVRDLYSYAIEDAQLAVTAAASHRHVPAIADPSTSAALDATALATLAPDLGPVVPVHSYESDAGAVRNQEQAMARLLSFYRQYVFDLPQLRWFTLSRLRELKDGVVQFPSLDYLLQVFPCASSVRGSASTGFSVILPQGQGPGSQLSSARLGMGEVLVARGDNPNRVMYSRDGRTWVQSPVFTNDAVEAQKERVWTEVMTYVNRKFRTEWLQARWMRW